jgi:hypothetical protein
MDSLAAARFAGDDGTGRSHTKVPVFTKLPAIGGWTVFLSAGIAFKPATSIGKYANMSIIL